jgi:hypothetical protein
MENARLLYQARVRTRDVRGEVFLGMRARFFPKSSPPLFKKGGILLILFLLVVIYERHHFSFSCQQNYLLE